MDQNRLPALSRPDPLHPSAVLPGNSKSSELVQPTILSLCTGVEEPEVAIQPGETDVTTKLMPAVTHEHVQPVQHTHLERRVTRTIHTHDIYHRVLPVIDTEILPPRHFVDDGACRREVPAEDVWKYTATGRSGQLRSTELRMQAPAAHLPPSATDNEQFPDMKQKAVLVDKKTYITDEGHPRTEYLWLHPPVIEDLNGGTGPVLNPAGFSSQWKDALLKQHHLSEECSESLEKIGQEDVEPMAKRRRTKDSERNGSLQARSV